MNTKLLRQKILDLAIRGKLTEQKKSDGTTKDLLRQLSSPAPLKASSPAPTGDLAASSAKKKNAKSSAPKEIIPLDKSEAPFEIPKNWEWVRLGDVCELISGQDFPPEKYNAEGKGLPYITGASNFSDSHVILNRWTEFPSVIAYKGDILLVCKGSGYGNYIYADFDEAHIARQIMAIRIQNEILKSYVFYFIGSQYDYLKTKGNGLVPGIARNVVLELEIPLPPLAEQQRIVEAIKNAFAEITAIENNQELLKKHIKQGRQKILDLAIRGKLTEQKPSDGTTKDLLASIMASSPSCHSERSAKGAKSKNLGKSKKDITKEIIPLDKTSAPFEIPENWEWVKLGDVCFVTKLAGFEYSDYIVNNLVESGIPLFKGMNIQDSHLVFDFEHYIPEEVSDSLVRSQLRKKCILTPYVGTIGNMAIFDGSFKAHLGSNVGKIETLETGFQQYLLEEYLFSFLKSPTGYKQLTKHKKATAQESISIESIRDVYVSLPPLAEQQRIVATIQESFAEFDVMEKG